MQVAVRLRPAADSGERCGDSDNDESKGGLRCTDYDLDALDEKARHAQIVTRFEASQAPSAICTKKVGTTFAYELEIELMGGSGGSPYEEAKQGKAMAPKFKIVEVVAC